MSGYKVILILGSNLGNTKKNIEDAILELEKSAGAILNKSEFLYSEPVEYCSNNIFCNIALKILTRLSPWQLLQAAKRIEIKMGRMMDSAAAGHYQDRIIDIDIVQFGNIKFESKRLKLPHQKHLYEREFSRKLLEDKHLIE
ncbi:2-amino-4-hydroxy-6-hydroxymethyldihydropteridinediphosphokinase [Cruoricaptor ignavus]|uniref:2-amino-4-hydroxy-6-hydroxymethyldihydropteridine pyrophosphokinase n=1 Tax=Cruoricaptor ignavus TaxID=1118202 RepID=A0A1M6A4F6_9FLAO|nr:2-amino-4-hydroxy-6-hydroxymethyldihydropteridine diphosphokinase [Cruoricaptor ignavus]SHI31391.1 2-amino-4-hydroxy-6-hydroxymethyldihydropteridinediphosphokinase [Cruoricaptor ignavus]